MSSSSISKRSRPDYYSRSRPLVPPPPLGVNSNNNNNNDTGYFLEQKSSGLYRYYGRPGDTGIGGTGGIRGGTYFERTFSQQQNIIKRERFMRRALSLCTVALTVIFMTYVWLSPLGENSNYHNHHGFASTSEHDKNNNNSYQGDHRLSQTSYEQIHLYRILGNDLPPRHKPGQVLQNLKFILENESNFPNTKKWWLLNRIVDSEYESAILDMLKRHKQDYIRIPFEDGEYMKRDFRLEDFPEPDFFHSYEYMNFSKVAKLRTIDYTYHDKNLYAMNNVSYERKESGHFLGGNVVGWIFFCFFTKFYLML